MSFGMVVALMMAVFGGSGGSAAVSFLRNFLINIKVTATPKLTAVTHLLAEFLRWY